MEKVLVTGVSGFLGHHCAVELLKNGYQVKGSVRDMNKKSEVLNGIKKEVSLGHSVYSLMVHPVVVRLV